MNETDALVGALGVMLLLSSVASIAVYVVTALGLSRMFGKADLEGWRAWVPVLNTITFLQLGGYPALWVIALLIPGVNIVGAVILCLALNNINRGFGRSGGFTVLGILVSPVWVLILGFGKDTWNPAAAGAAPLTGRAPDVAAAPNPAPGSSAVAGSPVVVPAFVPPAFVPPATPPAPSAAASWDRPAEDAPAGSSPTTAAFAPVPPVPFSAPTSRPAPVQVAVPVAWATGTASAPAGVPGATVSAPAAAEAAGPVAWTAPPVVGMQPLPPAQSVGDTPVSEAPPTTTSAPPVPVASGAAGAVPAPVAHPFAAASTGLAAQAPAQAAAPTAPGLDSDPGIEETVISRRRHPMWHLDFSTGGTTALTETVILLGRAPVRDHTSPAAQLVSLNDPARTVSKTHARLENVDGRWFITDLASTNGVCVTSPAGEETEISTGTPTVIEQSFLLGDYGISLRTGAR
ncbi:DUF5684 domain-containing protein [Cryobacterium cryoconiti]|uniref:FHA domain-containing protein n=1 Tax=Cryobacterium cryoconiti TaxID=1259239 RepID=A0A4Y8K0Y0_9MICO|nr:DUF5684 domain-containing protein [Cryobacterium cryoconiti]TFD32233.1 FHA domain-containing protein [Cryobacterium cryoconiti]